MTTFQHLHGVFAGAITPLNLDGSIAVEEIPRFLDFLARRGCHGALLLGTTGEGVSFSPAERKLVMQSSLKVRHLHPEFRLLAGTGTPSLEETIELTRMAFELGLDGVVTLPPYYYGSISDEGLFLWFSQVLRRAVPLGCPLFGYHIPSRTALSFSLELLCRLKDQFPEQFAGIKDSSSDPDYARRIGDVLGKDLVIYSGNDALFKLALEHSASGCITLMANLRSPDLRLLWEAHQQGLEDIQAQERLEAARSVMERYPPAPALVKFLLSHFHGFPRWAVRPPLLSLDEETVHRVLTDLESLGDFFGK